MWRFSAHLQLELFQKNAGDFAAVEAGNNR
jgi:hypothetical protein